MHQARFRMGELDRIVAERTAELFATTEKLKLLGAALEAASNSTCITDATGTIIWTNPAF